MRILVLGGDGMIGHHLLLAWQDNHDIKVTLHGDLNSYKQYGLFNEGNSYANVDVRLIGQLERIIEIFSPDAVVNAVGVTKQLVDSKNAVSAIEINSLFPHKLADLCWQFGARLVHLSTDCIFSGKTGYYSEKDISDAEDLYGRTKYLGEVDLPHVITLRKSTIGLELSGAHGLLEWFLAQKGPIYGFRRAVFSGLISMELANVIEMVLLEHCELSGVWNVASKPINKYDLLMKLNHRLERKDIEIIPNDDFICDRSLDGSRFETETGYIAPTWDQMLDDLALEIDKRYNKGFL